ncbi:MAG: hypothetical protein QOD51_2234 [Candidatus Eremiobacteraeota bacterium]|jgi:hypothetical protein|nr:hypothetical protein [Candidatus Eremiobacteraeota bacterium]
MPQPKKAPATPRAKAPGAAAKAAVAERNGTAQPRVEKIRGVDVTIPAQLPQTFIMDYAEMQEMQINQRPESIGVAAMVVKSVIGEEQWRAVRNAMAGEIGEDGGAAVLGELMSAILRTAHVEPGESQASATS